MFFCRGFAAFSARLQTLGKKLKFRSTQINVPGNRGKMASEGRNFAWRLSSELRVARGSPSAAVRPHVTSPAGLGVQLQITYYTLRCKVTLFSFFFPQNNVT